MSSLPPNSAGEETLAAAYAHPASASGETSTASSVLAELVDDVDDGGAAQMARTGESRARRCTTVPSGTRQAWMVRPAAARVG